MSYGFTAHNASNQILISSELQNLHFYGKATYSNLVRSHTQYGGQCTYRYSVSLVDGSNIPLVFIRPADVNALHAVTTISHQGNGVWHIDVMVKGSAGYPTLYIFAPPNIITPSSDVYGLQVFLNDGVTTSFDSRKLPLVVTGGGSISTSDQVITSSQNLNPYTSNTYVPITFSDTAMFCCPSLAQAEREYVITQHGEDCTGFDLCNNCIGWEETWASADTYWGFYREGYRLTSSGFNFGWITSNAGEHHWSDSGDKFLGINVGGGGGSSGTRPLNNVEVNKGTNTFIIADSSIYD